MCAQDSDLDQHGTIYELIARAWYPGMNAMGHDMDTLVWLAEALLGTGGAAGLRA